MRSIRLLAVALPLALLAACGGSAGDSAFSAAAPSYQALSMDLGTSEATPPALLAAPTSAAGDSALLTPDDPCHPHLFVRTHEVVSRVNRHLWRFLRRVENVIARAPTTATGQSQVWERVVDGIDVRLTVTRESDVLFTWKLELERVGAASFVTVFSGSIDRTNAQGPHQGTGDITLDLTQLAAVTGEEVAGVLTEHFETFAASRKLVVDAKDVVWDSDANAGFVRAPRDAHYVYDREPGKGGSLKIEEQMVFACPSNPQLLPADVKLVARWYRTTSGAVHGRSDARMTGGQLPGTVPPIDRVVGLTCHDSAAEGTDQAESSWLMKAEDATGATLSGLAFSSFAAGQDACDPVFGPVPTLADASNDFDLSAIDFTDANPFPFPGM